MDGIYEGARSRYIHPDECVDCRAYEPVCPVEAIYYQDDLPAALQPGLAHNDASFSQALPGRDAPLGSPGWAAKLGALGLDTPPVAGPPPQSVGTSEETEREVGAERERQAGACGQAPGGAAPTQGRVGAAEYQ